MSHLRLAIKDALKTVPYCTFGVLISAVATWAKDGFSWWLLLYYVGVVVFIFAVAVFTFYVFKRRSVNKKRTDSLH